MKTRPAEIPGYLAILEETAVRIGRLATGCTDEQLNHRPAPGSWSVAENLSHIRACADQWTFSIYAMLVEDDPALPMIDVRRWTKTTGTARLEFGHSLQAFAIQRTELLEILKKIPEQAWNRTGIIGDRQHSVFSQVRRMARHEAVHCGQIEILILSTLRIRGRSPWSSKNS